jgi:hypothetical protein
MAMSFIGRHPSATRLQSWLERGGPSRVSRHVADCERCMTALEELSNLDDTIVADIAEVLAPPEDIEHRAASQLERRLRNEDALLVFLDLFAVSWDTVRTIFQTEEDSDD